MAAVKKEVKLKESMYDLLLRPVITEKTSIVAGQNKITFFVDTKATKKEIKEAIETIYNVEVKSVNTLNQNGKKKRFKGIVGFTSKRKKAYITLKEGHNIDIMTGVK